MSGCPLQIPEASCSFKELSSGGGDRYFGIVTADVPMFTNWTDYCSETGEESNSGRQSSLELPSLRVAYI